MTHSPTYRVLRLAAFSSAATIAIATVLAVTLPAPRSGHRVGVTIGCAAQAAVRHDVAAGCEGTP
jgi:hypothetical protein